tara:strand:- start:299 stop:919 length:621 start_codon:yes stop_codon:yes gene_type:complete
VDACTNEPTCKGFIVQNENTHTDKAIFGGGDGERHEGKVYMLKSRVAGISDNEWNGDCYKKPLSSLNTNEQILFKANDGGGGGGGIKFDNMNEENNYFIIKNDDDKYLTYTNINNIPVIKYEVIIHNSIESKFKFKIDTLDDDNDNPFWGETSTKDDPPNYIIYPKDAPEVYLTLFTDGNGVGWLTIESKLVGGDSNSKRQIFSDN